jgi:hypothetical protein
MKRAKLLRILAIGVILSLLLAVIPASPALAAREIELDPNEGRIGDEFDIDGTDWPEPDPGGEPPYEPTVDIYFVYYADGDVEEGWNIGDEVESWERLVNDLEIESDGEFSETYEVPDRLNDGDEDVDVRSGTYYVCVTMGDQDYIRAVAEFTVEGGEIIDFDPTHGPVGTEVLISGENFAEDEELTIEYDGTGISIESDSDEETDGNGDFDAIIVIPPSTAGNHTVTIMDETLTELEETFKVESEMSFTPNHAPPDGTVTVTGTGFGDRADVDIFLGTLAVTSGTTDSDGSFSISFTVPDVEEGTYDLLVEDEDGNDDEGSFLVEIGIEISISTVTTPGSPGHVGDSITVSGTGFEANSTVTVTYATEPKVVATTTSDADGDFEATFDVPESAAGAHTITASDGTNSLELPFYMEAQAPGTPQLLLPETGTKAPSLVQFDWESVEDPSGVTYELQVATSEDFAADSMVLEMVGLTDSEYPLTKEEALESRSEEEPYYWRVRAIDGASNIGDWADTSTFHVGFAWPDWIIHLWWGLGVLGGVLFGYFLGKRRAYYY